MKYKFLLTLCLLFAPPILFSAQSNQAMDLATLLNSVKTMQADFVQTIYDNQGKVAQKAYGHMLLQRPGKFRWQVTKPIPQIIIANDTKLWIYDADLEQVTIRYLNKTQSETPALLLSHVDSTLKNRFEFRSLPSSKANWHWYELKPKQADSMFEWIKMGFYQNQIKEMQLQDHLDHHTIIHFNNIKMNTLIKSNAFQLKIPPHVDVIDETKIS